MNGPRPVHPRRSTSWRGTSQGAVHGVWRMPRDSLRASPQGFTRSVTGQGGRPGEPADGCQLQTCSGRPADWRALGRLTCVGGVGRCGTPAGDIAGVVVAGSCPVPERRSSPLRAGPPWLPRRSGGTRNGRPALAGSSEGSGDREQAQAANPDQHCWATLLSFDDLVPGLAGASPRALPAPSPPPARTGSPSQEEVTSKCCHDGLIRLFSTSRPLRRRETI